MHAHVAPSPRAATGLLARRFVAAGVVAGVVASVAVVDARGAAPARSVAVAPVARAERDASTSTARALPAPTDAWTTPAPTGSCPARTKRLPPLYEPDARTSGRIIYGGAPHLEPSRIRAVFAAHRDNLLACRKPGTAGRVVAAWNICEDGRVAGVATAGVDAATSACVARTMATWWFPRPRHGAQVGVTYPLDLQDSARPDLLAWAHDAVGFGDVALR